MIKLKKWLFLFFIIFSGIYIVQKSFIYNIQIHNYENLINEAAEDIRHRRTLFNSVCNKYRIGTLTNGQNSTKSRYRIRANYRSFYIDRIHNLVYCPICKSASSTIQYQLLRLSNYSETFLNHPAVRVNKLARKIYPRPRFNHFLRTIKDPSMIKLIVVRHPFKRLVSAYRDKLENQKERKYYYKKYGQKIVSKYRDLENNITSIEPTFTEFIKYLLNTKVRRYDEHWSPIYIQCSPCTTSFNFIAKLETFNRDQLLLYRILGLEHLLKPIWKHLTKGKRSETEITKQYMADLSTKDIQKLYQIYKLDFELFGYDINEYL